MNKVPMTVRGYDALKEELRWRQQEERPRIIEAIAEARSHGDLSENAEYHAAKEQQSLNEGRVNELEDFIARAEVIDVSKLSGGKVKFGATVVLVDEDTTGAAELLAAVLGGGVKGAMIIGRPPAGDPMIREPDKLSTGRYALLAQPQAGAKPYRGMNLHRELDLTGAGPADMSLAELHDATAWGELHQTESMGFCPVGEGGPFAETGATRLGGAKPVNTSGGLECRGHPIGASGLAQIHELVLQLRGEAKGRQVEGARMGLAENGGGNIGVEEAAMCIHILERA